MGRPSHRSPKGLTLSSFTADAAAELGGPAWLRTRRTAAAERFVAMELPTTDEEVWRYSRIDDFDLDRYRPALDAPASAVDGGLAKGEWHRAVGDVAGAALVLDGWLVAAEVAPAWAEKGLTVGALTDAADAESLLGERHADDAFVELNDAFAATPVLVRVPRGVDVTAPVVIHVASSNRADGLATFPRLVVEVGDGAGLTLVEHHESSDATSLSVPVTDLRVGQAGRLRHLAVQELGAATWQLGHQLASVGQEASLVSTVAGLGGDYARLRSDCRLAGRGASGNLLAVYFGEGSQMLDFRTFQDHRAPDTTSNLLFKGAVADESRSVYTGLIKVRPEGRGTNAFQTNRNIKLSDNAWAESVPNLEIENNDVRCSHASAVGPIDEEQRFYLESRGVPPRDAERLVVAGFFDEVLSQLPVPGAAALLRRRIAAKLDRISAGQLQETPA